MAVPIRQTGAAVADEILAILVAILFFFSIPNFPFVKKYFEESPYIIFGLALFLLVFRKKILEFFNSR